MTMENGTKTTSQVAGTVAATPVNGNNNVVAKNEKRDPSSSADEPPTKRVKVEQGADPSTEVKVEPPPPPTTTTATVPMPVQAAHVATQSKATSTAPVAKPPNLSSKPVETAMVKEVSPSSSVDRIQISNPQPGIIGGSPIVTPNPALQAQKVTVSAPATTKLAQVKEEPPSTAANVVGTAAEPTKAKPPTVADAAMPAHPSRVPPPSAVAAAKTSQGSIAPAAAKEVPLKSTTMQHLRTKYTAELEYMLREFRKLERQLLGAKGAAQLEESAGSRERREKLHSFILHLEDTIRQIETGCKLEAQGKSTVSVSTEGAVEGDESKKQQLAEASALTNLTKEKEEEENVQKLEEHILANLLPVKVRLKKQLAAQQGASRNPAGMPAPRRGSLQPSATAGAKGTFAAAAEQRRKQAEAARLAQQEAEEQAVRRVSDPTQFGKPLGGGGSSLTQKLHGQTLGSTKRPHGHGVGTSQKEELVQAEALPEKKILYGGMVPGSTQQKSGVLAASGVHEMTIEDTQIDQKAAAVATPMAAGTGNRSSPVVQLALQEKIEIEEPQTTAVTSAPPAPQGKAPSRAPAASAKPSSAALVSDDANVTEAEKRKLRKKRRKKKLLRLKKRREKERHRQATLHQQAQASQAPTKGATGKRKIVVGKGQGKKKGPRSVEYICALCSEAYTSTCDYNPWWALAQHECPKCRKSQIPRIDITSPANTIEYHPALLAHADENGAAAAARIIHVEQPPEVCRPLPNVSADPGPPSDSESELSELSDDSLSACSSDSEGSVADLQSMTAAERAEHESFGHDYKGPVLDDDHAGRLLILMAHASTCPCRHKSPKHRDVCISTKYMMLHVRDCPGTTSTFDVCPYPWCRKVKHLLYHLVSCPDPNACNICTPKSLSQNMDGLVGLNKHRTQKHRERLIAAAKAASAARSKGIPIPPTTRVPNLTQSTTPTIHPSHRKPTSKSFNAKQKVGVPVSSVTTGRPLASKPPATPKSGAKKSASAKLAPKASATVAIKPKESQAKPATIPATGQPVPRAPQTTKIQARPTTIPVRTTPPSVHVPNQTAASSTPPVISIPVQPEVKVKVEPTKQQDRHAAPTATTPQPNISISPATPTQHAVPASVNLTAAPPVANVKVETAPQPVYHAAHSAATQPNATVSPASTSQAVPASLDPLPSQPAVQVKTEAAPHSVHHATPVPTTLPTASQPSAATAPMVPALVNPVATGASKPVDVANVPVAAPNQLVAASVPALDNSDSYAAQPGAAAASASVAPSPLSKVVSVVGAIMKAEPNPLAHVPAQSPAAHVSVQAPAGVTAQPAPNPTATASCQAAPADAAAPKTAPPSLPAPLTTQVAADAIAETAEEVSSIVSPQLQPPYVAAAIKTAVSCAAPASLNAPTQATNVTETATPVVNGNPSVTITAAPEPSIQAPTTTHAPEILAQTPAGAIAAAQPVQTPAPIVPNHAVAAAGKAAATSTATSEQTAQTFVTKTIVHKPEPVVLTTAQVQNPVLLAPVPNATAAHPGQPATQAPGALPPATVTTDVEPTQQTNNTSIVPNPAVYPSERTTQGPAAATPLSSVAAPDAQTPTGAKAAAIMQDVPLVANGSGQLVGGSAVVSVPIKLEEGVGQAEAAKSQLDVSSQSIVNGSDVAVVAGNGSRAQPHASSAISHQKPASTMPIESAVGHVPASNVAAGVDIKQEQASLIQQASSRGAGTVANTITTTAPLHSGLSNAGTDASTPSLGSPAEMEAPAGGGEIVRVN